MLRTSKNWTSFDAEFYVGLKNAIKKQAKVSKSKVIGLGSNPGILTPLLRV